MADEDDDGLFAASEGDEGDEFGGFEANFGGIETPEETTEEATEPTEAIEPAAPAEEAPPSPVEPPSVEDKEETTPPVKVEAAPPSEKKQDKVGDGPKLTKRANKPLTPQKKLLRVITRRAGTEGVPPLEVIMRGKQGDKVKIKDIALFVGEPDDVAIAEVAKSCPLKNRVNLTTEITEGRVKAVGAQILEAGRMFTPIQVAAIKQPDRGGEPVADELQCTSGRHRLAFLALAYGPEAEIPVYVEQMTINEARDAVVVANQARPTKALEKAEHAVLRAVSGNADAKQDEMYTKTVTTKAKAKQYCLYCVIERKHPAQLDFEVSMTSSRKNGELTTVTNISGFWGNALDWQKGMERKPFDESLKKSVEFLNKLVEGMVGMDGFDSSHHLAAMTLQAVGKFYRAYIDIRGADPIEVAGKLAEAIVGMGEVGRQKSEQIYADLSKAMQ